MDLEKEMLPHVIDSAPNMFVLKDKADDPTQCGNFTSYLLQSYDRTVAIFIRPINVLYVFRSWDYSKTTMKHFKYFVNEHTAFVYENAAAWRKLMDSTEQIVYVTPEMEVEWNRKDDEPNA